MHHVLAGQTSQQISVVMCRSPRTIHVHRRHIMAKLGATNLVELVKQATLMGMMNRDEGDRMDVGPREFATAAAKG